MRGMERPSVSGWFDNFAMTAKLDGGAARRAEPRRGEVNPSGGRLMGEIAYAASVANKSADSSDATSIK